MTGIWQGVLIEWYDGSIPCLFFKQSRKFNCRFGAKQTGEDRILVVSQNEGIRFVKREKNNRVEFSHGRTIEMLDSHHAAW